MSDSNVITLTRDQNSWGEYYVCDLTRDLDKYSIYRNTTFRGAYSILHTYLVLRRDTIKKLADSEVINIPIRVPTHETGTLTIQNRNGDLEVIGVDLEGVSTSSKRDYLGKGVYAPGVTHSLEKFQGVKIVFAKPLGIEPKFNC